MCDTCGCGDTHLVPVEVKENLLASNQRDADHNREHFAQAGVFTVNLMGSPGSGKTALLEATASLLGGEHLRALSGDLATDNDGQRLRAAGISAKTITTGTACHLDARLVHRALHDLDWRAAEYLFVENVGNLVCPAIYDLGQAINVVALSVTEGEDKPLKYPTMFRVADLVVLTKKDLLPYLKGVSEEGFLRSLRQVCPAAATILCSVTTGEGVDRFCQWLQSKRQEHRASPAHHVTPHEHVHL